MTCPACGGEQLTVAVPAGHRERLRGSPPAVAFCPHCLHLEPAGETPPVDDPGAALHAVLETLPADREVAPRLALVLGLLENYALNRRAVQALVEDLEGRGIDVLLALDRAAGEPAVEACYDLDRRRTQVRQLLE